ncbi:MAG: GNAT family N-acetyltransferase [Ruminococcaceae bacterium]|nr:GNAT family N-acetyltransferase [Oscillospiraceae bacterium]
MTKIYLVRHAEAEGNVYRLAQGHFDGLVTKRGYDQIRALRRRFEGIQIDAVYSSDLFRARTTARSVSEVRGLPVILREELREINMGWWEGITWQEIGQRDGDQLRCFHTDLAHLHVAGGESAADARDRVMAELLRIAEEHEGQTVAVFSHGLVIRAVLGTLRGMALGDIDQTVLGDNTSVSLLEADNGVLREVWGNDRSHLVEAGLTRFVPRARKQGAVRFENGIGYHAPDEAELEQLRQAGCTVPAGGESIGVYQGAELAGLVHLAGCDGDVGIVDQYFLLPAFRGNGKSFQAMGQAVMRYRAQGCKRLRLVNVPEDLRAYFAQYGFEETENGAMEMSIGYEDRVI